MDFGQDGKSTFDSHSTDIRDGNRKLHEISRLFLKYTYLFILKKV